MTRAEPGRAVVVAETSFQVGQQLILEGLSPATAFAVVFEDDGTTGYLYGLDTTRVDRTILDALHIYNVDSVVDRELTSTARIMWSSDGLRSLLLINDVPHAGFDFEKRRGTVVRTIRLQVPTSHPPVMSGPMRFSSTSSEGRPNNTMNPTAGGRRALRSRYGRSPAAGYGERSVVCDE
jgi:hypothetical protein